MCNRFRLNARQAEVMRALGFDPPYPLDENYPPPREIFPSSKKQFRLSTIVYRSAAGNRPLELGTIWWGIPIKVDGKRVDKATGKPIKLDRFVTNARNLTSRFWAPLLDNPERRCLVPFTHFAEPDPRGGKGDDGLPAQIWFSLLDQPIGFFAGLWQPTYDGAAFAFVTTPPNAFVAPTHEKAMPLILSPADRLQWLDGSKEDALALVRPYDGPMISQEATPLADVADAM